MLPPWLTPDDLDHYVGGFTCTGFTGGLNWYRNFDRNWTLTPHLAGGTVGVPSLFVAGAADQMLMLHPPALMDGWLTDHRHPADRGCRALGAPGEARRGERRLACVSRRGRHERGAPVIARRAGEPTSSESARRRTALA